MLISRAHSAVSLRVVCACVRARVAGVCHFQSHVFGPEPARWQLPLCVVTTPSLRFHQELRQVRTQLGARAPTLGRKKKIYMPGREKRSSELRANVCNYAAEGASLPWRWSNIFTCNIRSKQKLCRHRKKNTAVNSQHLCSTGPTCPARHTWRRATSVCADRSRCWTQSTGHRGGGAPQVVMRSQVASSHGARRGGLHRSGRLNDEVFSHVRKSP